MTMALVTERKEQIVPLFGDAPFPRELRLGEIIRYHVNPAPSIKALKDFRGDTSIKIDNPDQQFVNEIKIIGGVVSQIEQKRAFSQGSSRFEFCFKMSPIIDDENGQKVARGVLYRFTLEPLDKKQIPARFLMHYGYQTEQPFTGILVSDEAIKEEQFGLPRCPDALDLRAVLTNVFAGEFAFKGIWDPLAEVEKGQF